MSLYSQSYERCHRIDETYLLIAEIGEGRRHGLGGVGQCPTQRTSSSQSDGHSTAHQMINVCGLNFETLSQYVLLRGRNRLCLLDDGM